MDRKERADKLVFRAETVNRFQIDGSQRSLPIVAMHNIRIKIQERHYFHHTAAEERIALAVVVIPVATGAFEIILVIDKIKSYAFRFVAEYPAILIAPSERHKYVAEVFKLISVIPRNIRIQRYDNAHIQIPVHRERL